MKKAKIMLSAIAVLAVVGGALAFKAKSEANVFCRDASNACGLVAFTTIKPSPDATPINDPCTAAAQTVYYTENQCQTSFIEAQNTVWDTDL